METEKRMQPKHQMSLVIARVKWFNVECGYGFIIDDHTGSDIILPAKVLEEIGWETIAPDTQVVARVQDSHKGLRVARILEVVSECDYDDEQLRDIYSIDYLSDQYIPARILRYSRTKGYGFARAYGDTDDIFIHWSTLERAGLAHVAPDAPVSIRVGIGKRGLVAASIRYEVQDAADAPLSAVA